MRPLSAAAAAALFVALPGAGQRDAVPAATTAGEPVDCVPLRNIRETRVRDDRTIDFVMRNGKVYRNDLGIACPRLGFERRFLFKTTIGSVCAVDTITVLETSNLSPGPTCGLGKFQPVTLAKR